MDNYCDYCGRTLSVAETSMHWPVTDEDGLLVCPDCYGDGAYCQKCTALVNGLSDEVLCDECLIRESIALQYKVDADKVELILRNNADTVFDNCGPVSVGDKLMIDYCPHGPSPMWVSGTFICASRRSSFSNKLVCEAVFLVRKKKTLISKTGYVINGDFVVPNIRDAVNVVVGQELMDEFPDVHEDILCRVHATFSDALKFGVNPDCLQRYLARRGLPRTMTLLQVRDEIYCDPYESRLNRVLAAWVARYCLRRRGW